MTEERRNVSKEDVGAKGKADKKHIKAEFNALKEALGDGKASGLLVKATERDMQNIIAAVEESISDEVNPLWADFIVVEEKAIAAEEKADRAEKAVGSLSQRVSEFEKLTKLSEAFAGIEASTEALQKKVEEVSEALTLDFQTKDDEKKTMQGRELIRYLADTMSSVHKGVGSVRRDMNGIRETVNKFGQELDELKKEVEGTLTLFMEVLQEKGILPKPEGD